MTNENASFHNLGLAPDMLEVLGKMKFTTPTPIQHKAIPIALEGKDIVGIAQTGTGKTMAFGIPTIQRLAAEGGQALVLVPTRELAMQVETALSPVLKHFNMKSALLIGGLGISPQKSDIKRHPDILIATPGRMNDHIYQGSIDLGDVRIAILDEADRMLDMGFEPQVKSVLRCVTHNDQTMLFSATMPDEIMKLATQHMKLPITIEIAPSGTAAKDVSQELFIVKESLKKEALKMLLQKYRSTVLVFTRTKVKAARLARDIKKMGAKVAEIHSDRSMSQRNAAMEGFKKGRYRVLVATDIAARGIDVSMIELVVNYDLPDEPENYVHRIGRTGRAGETGHAITFATPTQSRDVKQIEKLLDKTLPRSKHPRFGAKGAEKDDSRSSDRQKSSGEEKGSGARKSSGRRRRRGGRGRRRGGKKGGKPQNRKGGKKSSASSKPKDKKGGRRSGRKRSSSKANKSNRSKKPRPKKQSKAKETPKSKKQKKPPISPMDII